MANSSKIEWTDATWNPATGCDKVSEGCQNCYADEAAQHLQRMGQAKYKNGTGTLLARNSTCNSPARFTDSVFAIRGGVSNKN